MDSVEPQRIFNYGFYDAGKDPYFIWIMIYKVGDMYNFGVMDSNNVKTPISISMNKCCIMPECNKSLSESTAHILLRNILGNRRMRLCSISEVKDMKRTLTEQLRRYFDTEYYTPPEARIDKLGRYATFLNLFKPKSKVLKEPKVEEVVVIGEPNNGVAVIGVTAPLKKSKWLSRKGGVCDDV